MDSRLLDTLLWGVMLILTFWILSRPLLDWNMPTPKDKETEKEFVSRCNPIVMGESDTKDQSHAAAKCHGIYRAWQKKRREKNRG